MTTPGRRVRHAVVVLLAPALLVATAASACSAFGGDESSATTVPNGVRLVDLEPGQCYLAPANTDVRVVEEVPCADPHDAEAYATFALEGGPDAPFPGGADVQSQAQEGCLARFADYVGQAYEDSAYYSSAVAPTRRSWNERGDRRVLCSVLAADGGRLEGGVADGAGSGDG